MPENPDQSVPESDKLHSQNDGGGTQKQPQPHLSQGTHGATKDANNHADSPQTQETKPSVLRKLTAISTHNNLMSIFTGVVAAAAIVQGYSTCSQGKVLQGQWETMQQDLIATHRPWIAVDYAIGSDLKFSPEGGRLTVTYKTSNVGSSPAVGIGIDAVFHLLSPHQGDPIAEQEKVCARGRNDLKPGEFSAGDTLFPGRERLWEISIPISQADMKRSWADMAETHKRMPDTFISPVLVGCASYRFTFDGKIHKTRFIASLSRRDPNNSKVRMSVETSRGDVPAALLILDDRGFIDGGSFAD